jgi:hypothetical protein
MHETTEANIDSDTYDQLEQGGGLKGVMNE